MLINPDIRILIYSHKKEGGSEEFLRSIKHHFIRNEKFRNLFPEYCPQPNSVGSIEWGTADKILLPNRSNSAAYPESTVETAGLTTDVTGRHYNVIKADDLVTKESVTNETMIQKTRQVFSLMKFLFDQPAWGVMDIIGTPYHFNDLYATLRKADKISKVIVPILDKAGNSTFPERFTKHDIETEIRHKPGSTSYEFSCQYMLNPVPEDEQTFRPEWLDYLEFRYLQAPSNLKKYIFVDPASTQRKSSDFTAILVIGVDTRDHYYLLDIVRDKLNVTDRTNLVLSLAQKHDIHRIHYEAIGFQNTDLKILKRTSLDVSYPVNVESVKATLNSKEDRIRGLQHYYERGLIHWPSQYKYFSQFERKTLEMTELLRDEMLMFPYAQHDDMLDCHSFMLRIGLSKAGKPPKPTEAKDAFMWLRKKAIEAKIPKKTGKMFSINGKRRPWTHIPSQDSWW